MKIFNNFIGFCVRLGSSVGNPKNIGNQDHEK